jgi:hypothetical protein
MSRVQPGFAWTGAQRASIQCVIACKQARHDINVLGGTIVPLFDLSASSPKASHLDDSSLKPSLALLRPSQPAKGREEVTEVMMLQHHDRSPAVHVHC